MAQLEEDLHYMLDLLHKLAFASLTPANISQLQDTTQCVSQIRDASTLAQEIVWILEDNPCIEYFDVKFYGQTARISNLRTDFHDAPAFADDDRLDIEQRLTRCLQRCTDPQSVNGWHMTVDRDSIAPHLEARYFDPAAVLSTIAPQWSEMLVHRIDQATSHHALVHTARQGLRHAPG